jgi:hypothetical protein
VEENLVNLSPGMAITAEIKTGSRALITYLLSPLLKYRQESGGSGKRGHARPGGHVARAREDLEAAKLIGEHSWRHHLPRWDSHQLIAPASAGAIWLSITGRNEQADLPAPQSRALFAIPRRRRGRRV